VTASAQRTVDAPPARVFAVATDPERMEEWQRGVRRVRRLGGGRIGVGSRLTGERVVAGVGFRFTGEVTAWEPPRHYAFRVTTRGASADGELCVEPDGAGRSRVTARLDARVPVWLRLAVGRPRLQRHLAAHLAADLDALARLAAGSDPAAGAD
jgi:uncharacterized protein YndB with AHSA1/START domain